MPVLMLATAASRVCYAIGRRGPVFVVHMNQTAAIVERLEKATLEAKPAQQNP
jgi:hypothetical protein